MKLHGTVKIIFNEIQCCCSNACPVVQFYWNALTFKFNVAEGYEAFNGIE